MDAVRSEDILQTILVLAHSSTEDVNQLHPPENQSPLHVACNRGLVVLTQLLIWVRERDMCVGVSGMCMHRYVSHLLEHSTIICPLGP